VTRRKLDNGRLPTQIPPAMREPVLRSTFRLATKSAAYVVVAVTAIYALFRVVIPYTWGMHSDLAPIITVGVALGGAIGMAYLIYVMVRDLIRENRAAETGRLIDDDQS
jgi:hypothetical protein